MVKKFKVKSCNMTCSACPSQWDIYTTDGHYIYVRYRWGGLTLTLNFGQANSRVIYSENIGDGLDGVLTTKELKEHTKSILDWSLIQKAKLKGTTGVPFDVEEVNAATIDDSIPFMRYFADDNGMIYQETELDFIQNESQFIPSAVSLSQFTDEELRSELKRREKERHSKFPPSVRCIDCKHCTEGLTFKHQVIPTTICLMKPKTSQGPDRYYVTTRLHRACEKYEPK